MANTDYNQSELHQEIINGIFYLDELKELEAKYHFMTPEQRSRIVNFIINNE